MSGTFNGRECYCGKRIGAAGSSRQDEDSCNVVCTGDPAVMCGGTITTSAYENLESAEEEASSAAAKDAAANRLSDSDAATQEQEELQADKAMEAAVERGSSHEAEAQEQAHRRFQRDLDNARNQLHLAKQHLETNLAKEKQISLMKSNQIKQTASFIKEEYFKKAARERDEGKARVQKQVIGHVTVLEQEVLQTVDAITEERRVALQKANEQRQQRRKAATVAYTKAMEANKEAYETARRAVPRRIALLKDEQSKKAVIRLKEP